MNYEICEIYVIVMKRKECNCNAGNVVYIVKYTTSNKVIFEILIGPVLPEGGSVVQKI